MVNSLFFLNDPKFYPHLRPDCYPRLVGEVQTVIRGAGAEVYDGAKYVGRTKLRDLMHFAVESTEVVVMMYSEVVITSVHNQGRAGAVLPPADEGARAEEPDPKARTEPPKVEPKAKMEQKRKPPQIPAVARRYSPSRSGSVRAEETAETKMVAEVADAEMPSTSTSGVGKRRREEGSEETEESGEVQLFLQEAHEIWASMGKPDIHPCV